MNPKERRERTGAAVTIVLLWFVAGGILVSLAALAGMWAGILGGLLIVTTTVSLVLQEVYF